MLFFTICARNYLSYALVLMRSIRSQHPEAKLTIWLLDFEGEYNLDGLDVRDIKEAIRDEYASLMLRYNILEFATSVKPACIKMHFEEHADTVIYLDPDIYVFQPLNAVFDLLKNHDVVLTPHILEPLPDDTYSPSDLDILRSGIYNLGFIGLRNCTQVDALLDWWWSHLKVNCHSDPSTGVFTDQKWMNFAPVFFENIAILRNASYNVAYWNLTERPLCYHQFQWFVNAEPLIFYHFSGFNPKKPSILSRHQNRIQVKSDTALSKLLEFYADKLLSMDYDKYRQLCLPRFTFNNGVAADEIFQSLYKQANSLKIRCVDSGLSETKRDSFYDWCTEVIDQTNHKVPITRYLNFVYELRHILRHSNILNYPNSVENDKNAFINWLVKNVSLLKTSLSLPKIRLLEFLQQNQINYIGYLNSPTGLGAGARAYLQSLKKSGISNINCVDCTSLTMHESIGLLTDYPVASIKKATINIIHINADMLLHTIDSLGKEYFENAYNIGIWAWETPVFPEKWHDRFDYLDEVWAPSSFIANSMACFSSIPVITIPHAIPEITEKSQREKCGFKDNEFIYLFNFDYYSVLERKNPYAIIQAFNLAFKENNARLVIKIIHPTASQEADLAKVVADNPNIIIINKVFSTQEQRELLASCDCYISLHRSEGFGLGMAEAMSLGKPVIATGWSGNTDFMSNSNAFLVKYDLIESKSIDSAYPVGTVWAEPSITHAAELMRTVYESKSLRDEIGGRAKNDIKTFLSLGVVGEMMTQRLLLVSKISEKGRVQFNKGALNVTLSQERLARQAWNFLLKCTPHFTHSFLRKMVRRVLQYN